MNVLLVLETFMKDNEPPIAVYNSDFVIRFQRDKKKEILESSFIKTWLTEITQSHRT